MLESTPMWPAGGGFLFLFFSFFVAWDHFFVFFWWLEDVFYFGFFLDWGRFFGRDGLEHFDLSKCQMWYLPKILHAGFSDQKLHCIFHRISTVLVIKIGAWTSTSWQQWKRQSWFLRECPCPKEARAGFWSTQHLLQVLPLAWPKPSQLWYFFPKVYNLLYLGIVPGWVRDTHSYFASKHAVVIMIMMMFKWWWWWYYGDRMVKYCLGCQHDQDPRKWQHL